MGFTTGFLGGLTLTYSLLYLTIYVHRSNRTYQSTLLSQQRKLLLSSLEETPSPYYDLPPAYRAEEPGLAEQLKERWNREVANLVENVQETDWEEVRIRWEKRAGHVWGRVRGSEMGQEVEKNVREGVDRAKEGLEEGVEKVKEGVKDGAQKVRESVKEGADKVSESVKDGLEKARENIDRATENLKDAKDEFKGEAKEKMGQRRLLEEPMR